MDHNYVATATPRIKILDFRGFDSNIVLSLKDGILMECLSQRISVGRILVGRLGVIHSCKYFLIGVLDVRSVTEKSGSRFLR